MKTVEAPKIIEPWRIICAAQSEPDYSEERYMLIYAGDRSDDYYDKGYILLEGWHCSCYDWPEVDWDATYYEEDELLKIADMRKRNPSDSAASSCSSSKHWGRANEVRLAFQRYRGRNRGVGAAWLGACVLRRVRRVPQRRVGRAVPRGSEYRRRYQDELEEVPQQGGSGGWRKPVPVLLDRGQTGGAAR